MLRPKLKLKYLSTVLAVSVVMQGACLSLKADGALAQGVEQLSLENVPVPTRRPGFEQDVGRIIASSATPKRTSPAVIIPAKPVATAPIRMASLTATSPAPKIRGIKGSLKSGLSALTSKDVAKARAIRFGMKAGSIDRKVLAWAIALSGRKGVTSGEIAEIQTQLPNWPGQTALRNNMERAIVRETRSSAGLIKAFGKSKPSSISGAIGLAKAHLARGNTKAARAVIAPFWREKKLTKAQEKQVLREAGRSLTRADHRYRMHKMFYRERATAANRVASFAEQSSLAKARTAIVRKKGDVGKRLNAVAASSKRDPAYLFARIKHARRSGDYRKAAKLMLKVPKSKSALVHPDEWWIEQRIISRHMLDLGDAKIAYKIAANHSAQSRSKRAEAEFHAGWYALRFLKSPKRALVHFRNILKISNRPISQARANYWLGRASGRAGRKYYSAAAKHGGTFYGQLAAAKLKQSKLRISKPKPSGNDRARFKSRELVRAIQRLESAGYGWRADIIYRSLAKTLRSPGELALLSARAEKRGKASLALQIGKVAHRRGLAVDSLSWPLGAIPNSAKIGTTGKALAYSIARQESAFNKSAVSGANARGLLQLLPGTAKLMAKKKGLKYSYKKLTRNAGYNATLGAAYLSEQLGNFDNSYIMTFAGYNAGPGRVRKWIKQYGDPRGKSIDAVVDWIERIPFTETRNYVQRVMENYQVYKARLTNGKLTIVRDLRFGRK
ncbi:MAG: lytic transglycosylase domain-containing protein [Rhizobiaceae bacterium]